MLLKQKKYFILTHGVPIEAEKNPMNLSGNSERENGSNKYIKPIIRNIADFSN